MSSPMMQCTDVKERLQFLFPFIPSGKVMANKRAHTHQRAAEVVKCPLAYYLC